MICLYIATWQATEQSSCQARLPGKIHATLLLGSIRISGDRGLPCGAFDLLLSLIAWQTRLILKRTILSLSRYSTYSTIPLRTMGQNSPLLPASAKGRQDLHRSFAYADGAYCRLGMRTWSRHPSQVRFHGSFFCRVRIKPVAVVTCMRHIVGSDHLSDDERRWKAEDRLLLRLDWGKR